MANAILAALALLSLALALWQWLAARKFPLHQRVSLNAQPSTLNRIPPAISLLKPLKGCDATTTESLQSWFSQDYSGQTQILLGVAEADDPVCKIVRELLQKNPGCDVKGSVNSNIVLTHCN